MTGSQGTSHGLRKYLRRRKGEMKISMQGTSRVCRRRSPRSRTFPLWSAMTAICRLGSERSIEFGLTQVVIYHLPAVLHGSAVDHIGYRAIAERSPENQCR